MPTFDSSFITNHTCLRIKDPKISIPFYEKNFGLKHISQLHLPDRTLYILGIENESNKNLNWCAREGILELCHHSGSENDSSFKVNNGNGEKDRGFGHICFSVDNIEEAEKKLLGNEVSFKKKLSDGRQKNIAFALDPDGYWIELIEHGVNKVENKTDLSSYKLNHTMIRVKDPKASLKFYREVLGFKLFHTKVFEDAKFTLYFLGYESPDFKEDSLDVSTQATKQSVLELTHNWGTENDDSFPGYHDGNSTENGAIAGYGHFGIACDNAEKLCREIESEFPEVEWALKYGEGPAKIIAFVKDPDGYQVEIFNTDSFKDWTDGKPPL
ncbi:lactoylglutathione lyase [Hyphopichia burtonii NRRL Y-1933]|uniref:Lactoylglutathione lyase n=1 Tax=Hyphopichia burtonii NRRL Y-1933 TaxID=984485 RepID=A0A1E4RLZ3_9ASCO|nr:lactoylglutathione lyase [Hyphopichia burtonii NRRL Y-1933]ODV68290.1 lactoylglutathione lyase [Hyphopichia burtonii NRRL Y-1933]